MSTFIGALLDVSRSMEVNMGDGIDEEGGTWIRSIFKVIDDLIKHDVSNTNRVFAVGVGASNGKDIFDTLGTIQDVQRHQNSDGAPAEYQTIEECFQILEHNGANAIRSWAKKDTVRQAVSENDAQLILKKLRSNQSFTRKFVYEYLPDACRNLDKGTVDGGGLGIGAVGTVLAGAFCPALIPVILATSVATTGAVALKEATTEDVKEVVRKAMASIDWMKELSEESVFGVQEAADIIHGCVEERELTTERARELLKIVDPYIYGYTPLYAALREASVLFHRTMHTYPNHYRLLFILSDGDPTDNGNIDLIKSQLRGANVTVVGCYICRSSRVAPKRLYSIPDRGWEEGAEFLFNLSSTIPTELVTRAIFIKHGWQIDIANNETKLFLHVNHPDHLKDVCKLARNTLCCQDTLSDLLVSVDLDVYINQTNSSIKAHEQVGGTCYANASAAALHLAMHRILGRDHGYPEFEELRDIMINRYGIEGAVTFRVLRDMCPQYRLRCQQVDVNGAMRAVAAKRSVVAIFFLRGEEWDNFGRFYHHNPTGILKRSDLEKKRRGPTISPPGGHAVVLTSFNSECLRLMNSWGDNWADMGFFRVANAEVLGLQFIDVYWTLDDLSQREKEYYRRHGSEVAEKLMRQLKGLQEATFTCSLCNQASNVTAFKGTLSHARCPRCGRQFSTKDGEGNILALNMYLTSLSK